MHTQTAVAKLTDPIKKQQTDSAVPYQVSQVSQDSAITVAQSSAPFSENTANHKRQPATVTMPAAEKSAIQAKNESPYAHTPGHTQCHAPRYISLKTVLERAGGFSKSTWHDWSNPRSPRYDPTIPRSVCLSVTGRGCVRWIEDEVDAWLAAKAETGRK